MRELQMLAPSSTEKLARLAKCLRVKREAMI